MTNFTRTGEITLQGRLPGFKGPQKVFSDQLICQHTTGAIAAMVEVASVDVGSTGEAAAEAAPVYLTFPPFRAPEHLPCHGHVRRQLDHS